MDRRQKIAIIGPAHPLRGGLTTFNHRLAKEFIALGDDCVIYSYSLQYPSFLFPGTSQFTDEPAPANLTIYTIINSVNPLNWVKVGRRIAKDRPDIILVRFWIPFMGPALGTILRLVMKNKHTRIIGLADNIIPHEKRPGDKPFTKYFLGSCDAFITMSEKVMSDLRSIEKSKPAQLVAHPLYDNFGAAIAKDVAREKLGIDKKDKVILFFGFIRKYKGLDILLEAMADARIKEAGIKLLVAGEFYEDEKVYQEQIDRLGIRSQLIMRTQFIPDSEVVLYFCAADVVIQPYRNATQSGVTPLAYHYEKPMIVTNVGGLPAMVPDRKSGLVAAVQPMAIASAILEFYELGEEFFIPHLRSEKQKLSWSKLVETIKTLV
ncbi:MAG TPA: glycosyltransferase [Saprospiraceae bacterium]|jgi:glycosyltransferase involved in cell wall biosynthesis|nr:glycosyltransferase [Saprospiraceae bacterium]HQW25576.1 glycosyltransferase [Saprospiraceae bacterium]HQW25625.1 glycosyltransferase [Saprospiraceae bacterium]